MEVRMKMKPFRYSTQIALRETINGLLWCIAAILWVFDNPACKVICVVLLAIAVSSQACVSPPYWLNVVANVTKLDSTVGQ